jgi:hypothetical protein
MDYNSLAACTLYIKRLDPERLNSEAQVKALRERLFLIAEELETHPLDIIVKRSLERKGQAFIVYADPAEASTAKDLLDGFEFTPGGRTLICELARTPSDAVVKRFCSEEQYEEHLKKRKYEKGTLYKLLESRQHLSLLKMLIRSQRTQTGRKRRRTTSAKARRPRRRDRNPTSQSLQTCSQTSSRSRRIPTSKQCSLRARDSRRIRRGCFGGYVQSLCWLQRSAYDQCREIRGYSFRGI